MLGLVLVIRTDVKWDIDHYKSRQWSICLMVRRSSPWQIARRFVVFDVRPWKDWLFFVVIGRAWSGSLVPMLCLTLRRSSGWQSKSTSTSRLLCLEDGPCRVICHPEQAVANCRVEGDMSIAWWHEWRYTLPTQIVIPTYAGISPVSICLMVRRSSPWQVERRFVIFYVRPWKDWLFFEVIGLASLCQLVGNTTKEEGGLVDRLF